MLTRLVKNIVDSTFRSNPKAHVAPLLLGVCCILPSTILGKTYETAPLPEIRTISKGPFEPTWESLIANYECPEWFRDAKFGIWAHWSAQCVPEQGDWYGRSMYIQGHPQYEYHVKTFGHPTEVGFMEIDHLWKADKWDSEALMDLYIEAGAKFFVALANHEDNFDCYDSKYHAWNSVNVGPMRDVVGTWAKVARKHGLRFGVSNHSTHSWHWLQPAYGYDAEGPLAGQRYDAYRLTKEEGKGKWWEGLDPQELYSKPSIVIPNGFTNAKAAQTWHDMNNLPWTELQPPNDAHFVNKWFFRLKDLIDSYEPDFLYLDNTEIPFGQVGLDIVAHYYNQSIADHSGKQESVLTAKGLSGAHRPAVTQAWERSVGGGIQEAPFETDTCIGQWHYKKDIDYKTAGQVMRILVDVVSKNGTLLLSIPQKGDGTIDDQERIVLKDLGKWMHINSEGIYGSRPWKTYGEGPTQTPRGRDADMPIPYTQEDMRFTTKDGFLYIYVLAVPETPIQVKTLGLSHRFTQAVKSISMLGSDEPIRWQQEDEFLSIECPNKLPCNEVITFKIAFK
jgi:alpha-L-fucosidase